MRPSGSFRVKSPLPESGRSRLAAQSWSDLVSAKSAIDVEKLPDPSEIVRDCWQAVVGTGCLGFEGESRYLS